MKKILMLIISLIILTGCELITPEHPSPRNIYLVSVALNYEVVLPNHILDCTLNDQEAICDEFKYISDECDYPLTTLVITQRGINYSVYLNGDAVKTEEFSSATTIKEDVLSWLHELAAGLDRNDLLVFHYSGHGLDGNGELVLNLSDNKYIVINSQDLYQAVKDTDGIKFFVLDSCYSGVYADTLTPENPSSPFRDFFTLDSPNENIFVLTGASSDEKSNEPLDIYGYGFMTECFLESLGFSTNERMVGLSGSTKYYSEVVSFVQKNIGSLSREQHPEGAAIKDFLIYSRKRQ